MSNTNTFIAHIRSLIAKDDFKTAIQQVSDLLKNSPLLDEAVQQSARYNNVMKEIRLGLVDYEAANITQNQIRFGVLELLREIEDSVGVASSHADTTAALRAEVERAISIVGSKNVVVGSTITAGGDVKIGDNVIATQQNHSGEGDNVAGDKVLGNKITNIINEKDKPPRFLTGKPFKTDFFIGRDTDLAAIETEYQHNKRLLVLVNGEGGMGKTTLAAQYWFLHEKRYKHLAWMFSDSGIGNALLSLENNLGVQFHEQDDTKAKVARIMEGIANVEAPCLLVFDNANNAADLEQYFVKFKQLSNCHILLTSRVTKLADAPVHRVLPLRKEDALNVFKKYYPQYTDKEGAILDKLLLAVGSNTLVIELLAKNLAVFNDFDTAYSINNMVADLQQKGLFALQNEVVDAVYQSDMLRKETPENIIAAMYDLSALTEAEIHLLNNFAVLPAENIPFYFFKDLVKSDNPNDFKKNTSLIATKRLD